MPKGTTNPESLGLINLRTGIKSALNPVSVFILRDGSVVKPIPGLVILAPMICPFWIIKSADPFVPSPIKS